MKSRYTEVGLIDDDAFAHAWVSSRQAGRGLATRALALELQRKGIDQEVAGRALATVDSADEEQAARQLVARKLPGLAGVDDTTAMRRLLGMLVRKSYPADLAHRLVREALSSRHRSSTYPVVVTLTAPP